MKPGRLEAIWIKRVRRGPMDAVNTATLIAGEGIRGNANQRGRRHVTIIEQEVWHELMQEVGTSIDPSSRRANLMISGVPLRETRGRMLRVGECEILIGGETKPCERMEEAAAGLQVAMYPEWRGGAYGTIIKGGEIRVGDRVALREPE